MRVRKRFSEAKVSYVPMQLTLIFNTILCGLQSSKYGIEYFLLIKFFKFTTLCLLYQAVR